MVTGLTTASVTESNIPETAHVTEYSYDPYLNAVTEIIQPDGTKQYYEYNYWNLVEEQGYEKDGETSGVINNTYSVLGQLEKQEAQADGKENVFEYNNIGQIVRAVDDSGVRTYEYDERGRVTKETNGSEVKEYSYDENDNRTSLTVKRGGTVVQQEEYMYNRLNQLTQVKDGSGSVLASYTYNADGKITSESKGGALTTEYVYNTGGQLKSKTNKKAVDGSVIGKYDYSYYFDGNILSENDKLYEYDKQGRLVKEGNAENVQEYTSYSYDRFGNRESMEYVVPITGGAAVGHI